MSENQKHPYAAQNAAAATRLEVGKVSVMLEDANTRWLNPVPKEPLMLAIAWYGRPMNDMHFHLVTVISTIGEWTKSTLNKADGSARRWKSG